jgi:hypothetical protein
VAISCRSAGSSGSRVGSCGSWADQPSRPTRSSTAPATRSASRSSILGSWQYRATTCRCGAARPGEDDLFFMGLLQPRGATMPLAEAKAKQLGELLVGRYALLSAGRCEPTWNGSGAGCSRATLPSSGKRCRWTSTAPRELLQGSRQPECASPALSAFIRSGAEPSACSSRTWSPSSYRTQAPAWHPPGSRGGSQDSADCSS